MLEPGDFAEQYKEYLVRVGKSEHTVKAYTHAVTAFGGWWGQTTGQAFNPQTVDSRDIQSTSVRQRFVPSSRKPDSPAARARLKSAGGGISRGFGGENSICAARRT